MKFPVYPDREYGEMAGYTSSVWYNGEEMVEIEPFGPLEIIPPGDEVSFILKWYLASFPHPANRRADLDRVRKMIHEMN